LQEASPFLCLFKTVWPVLLQFITYSWAEGASSCFLPL